MGRKLTELLRWAAIGLIRFYQITLSPLKQGLFGPSAACRFQPTCSQYALECFQRHPLFKAFLYTMKRLLRCHPFCAGGRDPVPEMEATAKKK